MFHLLGKFDRAKKKRMKSAALKKKLKAKKVKVEDSSDSEMDSDDFAEDAAVAKKRIKQGFRFVQVADDARTMATGAAAALAQLR